ncbi:synaptic vesicle glycoprotein 2C-like, partial [Limulus polyphemus]|uniref:Synaptic vesicle glycoprotein 2C-like n=1 Tax=Limulus polyphemus TaxID=6850 RepID=A0ABM1RZI9_LIMPO
MSIWFPEYIKKLHIDQSKTDEEYNRTIQDVQFNVTMENIHFQHSYFQNVQFQSMILSHCLFEGCIFVNCTFSDVRSSKTFFRNSEFLDVLFVDTDFHDYRFQNCSLYDSSFFSTKAGCTLDFDISFDLQPIFLENLLAQLAIIPGNIMSSYVLDQLGRVKTMGTSLFLTSLSAFFIWFLESKAAVIGFETVFNFISISGWNGVDVITTETYPAHL